MMLVNAIKFKSLDELTDLIAEAKAQGLRVAQCHGVFDLLHPGHIRHFEAARKVADILVVTLIPDEYVAKGPGRPVFNQRLRAESIAALQAVDYVAVNSGPTVAEAIYKLCPDFYVKGSESVRSDDDKAGEIREEERAIRSVGGQMYFTEEITFSSTNLLNNFFAVFSPEADEYLRGFRRQYSAEQVIEKLGALQSLRVLVLGDVIIDEYHYCKAVGKSSKSATLTARFLSAERHAGGVLAVANHVAGFAGEVHLLTYLGDPEGDEAFVHGHLKPNVRTHLVRQPGRPNVVKRRYVDPFQISKMFEVMWLNGEEPLPFAENEMLTKLAHLVPQSDLVIVADFGHGSVGRRTIEWLSEQPIFLAVNAQTNSANVGYNLITKYHRADYICIDEQEMRLANHSRYGNLVELTAQVTQRLNCQWATVTRGANGSLTFGPGGNTVHIPVFSTDVVDSVGAGDAYLSVTALCARKGYDPAVIGFIGNCVGALAVRIVGNREPVEPEPLFRFIATLLK
jgi:cytidyltransferase-like protein